MHPDLRRRLGALTVLLLLATALMPAQQSTVIVPAGFFPNLEVYLESLRVQAGIPGMSAAVVQDGEVVWERGFGFQNVSARVRATPDTPYVVGDVSATLGAVLLLQCVEERRLSLDEPVGAYGMSFPESGVTLRKLLSHTSTDTFVFSPERFARIATAIEFCAPQPFAKSVAHRLLNRLAMKDSVPGINLGTAGADVLEELFDPADLDRYRRVVDRLATPYKVDSRGRVTATAVPSTPLSAAGGLVSTVRDLARFEAAVDLALLDSSADSGALLRPETLAVAWSPVAVQNGGTAPTGLGWFVQPSRAGRVVWSFGLVPNAYSSLVLKLPERHLTFILLANSDGLSAPFQLGSGDVTRSLFATFFLKLAS
jgi:CubicO group peptidase (beta-lactamase class C family)